MRQEPIKIIHNTEKIHNGHISPEGWGVELAERVAAFHRSFPEYSVTPLVPLSCLAGELGVGGIYVKDESRRFGLNAFKVLGGSYAIGSYIAGALGIPLSELTCERITGREIREKLGERTFVTATDGNHGRGVAWTAHRLGQKSVVYMPKGSARERLENIRQFATEASITDYNYDDTVRMAAKRAAENKWVLVQDTAWEGYEDIPLRIMQGYTTMAYEAAVQLGETRPTHIFLQAGVGSMAAAVTAFFRAFYTDGVQPVIVIVEPHEADCLFRTARAADGSLHAVTGDMNTIMAGLACGEPCSLAWDILRDHADAFVSMPDYVAANGMRILGSPLGTDERIISGESGASTTGLVTELLRNPDSRHLREQLGMNADSQILCISTEGDTDKANYRRIVWDGTYAAPLP